MFHSWSRVTPASLLLLGAFVLLTVLAVQYPLSVTFPAGGDAAVHVRIARNISSFTVNPLQQLRGSWYPAANVMFAVMKAIPGIDWPTRFVWFMAAGQIATGGALALLLYRLSGPKAGAAAMAIWALTPIVMTPFFEDATMPQLWSLPWLVLFFERYVAGSLRGMGIMLLLTMVTHPISGLIAIAALTVAAPLVWLVRGQLPPEHRRLAYALLIITGLAILGAGGILLMRQGILKTQFIPGGSPYLPEMISGEFFIWTLASIPGALWLVQRHGSRRPDVIILLGSFTLVSLLLGLNHALGIGFLVNRLVPYTLIPVTIGAAYALPRLLSKTFQTSAAQLVLASTLLLALTMNVWHFNAHIYRRYESPSLYVRLHYQEREAIEWMNQNISPSSSVFTTTANRHYEWIPALTNLTWAATSNRKLMALQSDSTTPHYIVYFTHQEGVPGEVRNDPAQYPVAFSNDAAVVLGPVTQ